MHAIKPAAFSILDTKLLIQLFLLAYCSQPLFKMRLASLGAAQQSLSAKENRIMRARLTLITLFTAFEDELSSLPLPRSSTSESIGIDQSLKDATRERITINGRRMEFSQCASSAPNQAATELTNVLSSCVKEFAVEEVEGEEVGRVVGRCLSALSR